MQDDLIDAYFVCN